MVAGVTGAAICRDRTAAQTSLDGIELVTYDSAWASINAVLFRPAPGAREGDLSGKGLVLLHGSGGAQDDVRLFTPGALALAARGCTCLMPNYYDATPGQRRSSEVAARRWRRAIRDGALWLANQPGLDSDGVAGLGFSRGAGLGLNVALADGGLSAFIAVAGGAVPERITHRPPVLMVFAEDDPVVPARRVRAAAASLREQGVSAQTQVLASRLHRFADEDWRSVFQLAGDFIQSARPL